MTSRRTGTGLSTRIPWDVATLLTLFAVLRFVLPNRFVIGPLGGAGSPAQLLGLAIGLWWLSDWLGQPWPRSRVAQPLRRQALILLAAVWASYLVAALRSLSPDEQLAADRSVLNMVVWIGLMLAAMDGITSRERLNTLLRRLVLLGGLEAAFGILQMLAGRTFVDYLHLPGLLDSGVDETLLIRGGFVRPAGTAVHPIEFGVVLAMMLPLALHYAVGGSRRRSAAARWWPVCLMAVALALSVSRSAIICTVVALFVLLGAWPQRYRRLVYLAVPVLLGGMALVRPGFFSTITGMFTGISDDPSTQSRTDSYAVAWAFIARNPVFGRGTGTFLPRYWILDNQYLLFLIETGVLGLVSLILLLVMGSVTAGRLRWSPVAAASGTPGGAGNEAGDSMPLGPALGAGIAGAGVSLAFFDAWSFPMVPSMLFLLLGCVGALRRLTLEGDREPPVAAGDTAPGDAGAPSGGEGAVHAAAVQQPGAGR